MRIRVKQNYKSLITDELEHPGISPGTEYFVLDVSDEYYRVVDDGGEPVLYPKQLFEVLDVTVPPGWQFKEYEYDDYRLVPVRTSRPGFYEDFFCSDGDRIAQKRVQQTLREELEHMRESASPDDKPLIDRALAALPVV